MYARIATFEGTDPSRIDEVAANIRQQAARGEEDIPAKEILLLADRSSGKVAALTLFETEDDLRKGNEKLNSMTPPSDSGMGSRSGGAELYEVVLSYKP